jgi:hypothetical protein
MICPLCHSQMIKVRVRHDSTQPGQIRCIQCRFAIFYRGLKAT